MATVYLTRDVRHNRLNSPGAGDYALALSRLGPNA